LNFRNDGKENRRKSVQAAWRLPGLYFFILADHVLPAAFRPEINQTIELPFVAEMPFLHNEKWFIPDGAGRMKKS